MARGDFAQNGAAGPGLRIHHKGPRWPVGHAQHGRGEAQAHALAFAVECGVLGLCQHHVLGGDVLGQEAGDQPGLQQPGDGGIAVGEVEIG